MDESRVVSVIWLTFTKDNPIFYLRYQTHQLRNVSSDYCATINCYRYDEDDPIQWNLFDYVNDANGQMGNFFPNTDFSFGEMRQIVLDEWANRYKSRIK